MEFWKKKDEPRVSPSDPNTHPDYKRAKAVGEKRYRTMKFESEEARRDYLKAVESNPNNVVGLPPFYPAAQIRSFISMERQTLNDQEKVDKFIRDKGVRDTDLYCDKCDKITTHSISPDDCFCKKCGDRKRWRSGGIDPFHQLPFGS